jgi:hypothetical protein
VKRYHDLAVGDVDLMESADIQRAVEILGKFKHHVVRWLCVAGLCSWAGCDGLLAWLCQKLWSYDPTKDDKS